MTQPYYWAVKSPWRCQPSPWDVAWWTVWGCNDTPAQRGAGNSSPRSGRWHERSSMCPCCCLQTSHPAEPWISQQHLRKERTEHRSETLQLQRRCVMKSSYCTVMLRVKHNTKPLLHIHHSQASGHKLTAALQKISTIRKLVFQSFPSNIDGPMSRILRFKHKLTCWSRFVVILIHMEYSSHKNELFGFEIYCI